MFLLIGWFFSHGLLKLAKGDKVTCVTEQGSGASQTLATGSATNLNMFSAARIY